MAFFWIGFLPNFAPQNATNSPPAAREEMDCFTAQNELPDQHLLDWLKTSEIQKVTPACTLEKLDEKTD